MVPGRGDQIWFETDNSVHKQKGRCKTMSRELVEARQRIAALEEEVGNKEKEIEQLQEELEARAGRIAEIMGKTAEGEVEKREAERKLRDAQEEVKGLQATIDAQKREVEKLDGEKRALRKQLDDANPALQEELRQEAEELKRKDEKRVRMTAFKAGLAKRFGIATLVALIAGLVFAFLKLFDIETSWFLRIAVPTTLFVTAFIGKEITSLIEHTIWPTIARYWRATGIIGGLTIGAIIASFGVDTRDPVYLIIFTWFAVTIGYGAVIHGLVESIYVLATNAGNEGFKAPIGLTVLGSILGGIFLSGINPMGWVITPFRLLMYIIGGTVACGAVILAAAVIGWIGIKIFSTLPGLWERQLKGQRAVDIWLRRARALTVGASVLVGIIVGMSLWPQNGENASSYVIAVAMGIVLSVAFFLIEGKILEKCFLRSASNGRLLTLVVMGILFASLTGFLTFSKLYSMGSSSQRFKASQSTLLKAENAYMSATESTAISYAEEAETEQERIKYTSSVDAMKDAAKLATYARDYTDLEKSVLAFTRAGREITDTLPKGKEGLLDEVRIPPQPHPIELGNQVLFGWKIEGVEEVYGGAALMAACATLVVDYLISLFAIFGWIISGRRRKDINEAEEGEAGWGHVISAGDEGKVLIDIGTKHGVELGDTFTVVSGQDTVGSLHAENSFGDAAFFCSIVGNPGREIESGMRVRMN